MWLRARWPYTDHGVPWCSIWFYASFALVHIFSLTTYPTTFFRCVINGERELLYTSAPLIHPIWKPTPYRFVAVSSQMTSGLLSWGLWSWFPCQIFCVFYLRVSHSLSMACYYQEGHVGLPMWGHVFWCPCWYAQHKISLTQEFNFLLTKVQ